MTNNCTQNPTFCNFAKVGIKYCDGTSFTSIYFMFFSVI